MPLDLLRIAVHWPSNQESPQVQPRIQDEIAFLDECDRNVRLVENQQEEMLNPPSSALGKSLP
jgi:hypothetical protein